jgi:glycopeptide antibiotics resistance protein
MTTAAINTRRQAFAVALYLLVFWVLVLFPFDFHWPYFEQEPPAGEATKGWNVSSLIGVIGHVVLFIPVGAFVYTCTRERSFSKRTAVLAAALGLVVVSELAQFFVSRSVSFGDGGMNVVGLLLGLLLARLWEPAWRLQALTQTLESPGILGMVLVVVPAAVLWLRAPVNSGFGNWDGDFPLMLANEKTCDRPWRGELHAVAIFDRALSGHDARRLSSQLARHDGHLLQQAVVFYSFSSDSMSMLNDSVRTLDDLSTRGSAVKLRVAEPSTVLPLAGGGITIRSDSLITSGLPAARLCDRLRSSDGFTIAVKLRPQNLQAEGPARIVSLSSNPFERNFTLGQERDALHFRVRTPFTGENGIRPALTAERCLRDDRSQVVIAVCDGRGSRLYLDGKLLEKIYFARSSLLLPAVFGLRSTFAWDVIFLGLGWAFFSITFFHLLGRWRRDSSSRDLFAGVLATVWMLAAVVVDYVLKQS